MKNSPVANLFKKHFGESPIHIVRAPGRLELLGNHTDYNEGLVMAVAVDKYISIASSPRTDGRIELISSAFEANEAFRADDLKKNPAAPWADYVKGVLLELRQRNVHFSGFNAAIHGTLPLGSGMSSSAALEVATALTVRQLAPYALSRLRTIPGRRGDHGESPPLNSTEKLEIARICQAAENKFVGVNCGALDPISCLFGKASHAIEIDCQSLAVELVPMAGDIAVIVCHTGVRHQLVDGEYNELRRQCELAAQLLGVKSLRAVDSDLLAANKARLPERAYQCAFHVVGEIHRVVFGARALRAGDLAQFGQYMFQSHESSRDFFKNSCAELDVLVELARSHSACLGARLTGGGFGGATINLVERGQAPTFMGSMAAHYEKQTGRTIEPMLCQIVDGAHSLTGIRQIAQN